MRKEEERYRKGCLRKRIGKSYSEGRFIGIVKQKNRFVVFNAVFYRNKSKKNRPSSINRDGFQGGYTGGYFAANSNVFTDVFVALDFEVTVTVATQRTPAVNPVTVTGLLAVVEERFVVKTVELSNFFFTVTSTVTPSFGNVEVIFAFMANEVPTTANTVL